MRQQLVDPALEWVGTYAKISNKGAARSSVLYTTPTGMRGGESSSGMEVGVRHSF